MEKGLIAIKEFVSEELEDYGYFKYKETKFTEEYPDGIFYYDVTLETSDDKEKLLRFKYEDEKIFIELGEDSYEEVKDYDTSIKYFWMALLKWEV